MNKRIRKPAAERKDEIVDTAIRLAAEIGPGRLTMQVLADEIGISQPAVFRHFPNKNALWQAIAVRIAGTMKASVNTGIKVDLPPGEKLLALVIGQLRFIQANPAIPAILFSRELHADNENLRSRFAGLMAGRHESFAELIEQEKKAGGFVPDLDASDASFLLLAFIQGLAMRWSLTKRSFDLVVEGKRLLECQMRAFKL